MPQATQLPTFIINDGYDDRQEVRASHFAEQGSFVIFYWTSSKDAQVLALPTSKVYSIKRSNG